MVLGCALAQIDRVHECRLSDRHPRDGWLAESAMRIWSILEMNKRRCYSMPPLCTCGIISCGLAVHVWPITLHRGARLNKALAQVLPPSLVGGPVCTWIGVYGPHSCTWAVRLDWVPAGPIFAPWWHLWVAPAMAVTGCSRLAWHALRLFYGDAWPPGCGCTSFSGCSSPL